MEIVHVANQQKWLALDDEVQIGEVNYRMEGPILVLHHTEVEPKYRGNRIAADLVLAVFQYAQEQDFKINPLCPYSASILDAHPEYAALRV